MPGPPRPHSHSRALFSLIPLGKRAENVVGHPCNRHLVSTLQDGRLAIGIGFHIRSKSCGTLATLGRGEADIFVEGSSIAKIQCSFEIDLDTNIIMLYDRSHGQTTQVSGTNAIPFEHGRPRKIVVQKSLNDVVGMGGVGKNIVLFELLWHQGPEETMERVKNRANNAQEYEENPRFARTVDELETVLPSQRETRPHTPGAQKPKMRYRTVNKLGSGQFGTVHKAIDVDTAKLMAVKILRRDEQATKQEAWKQSVYYALKREVEILSQISHPHIVDYIASQGWDGPEVEIFMGLKEGTLQSLVDAQNSPSITTIAHSVFHQMLQALDFLAAKGIVHRDVKPENILYVSLAGGHYQFQLGDFGLCNRAISAATLVGSPLFMAPEMFHKGDQTHKVDVWSLFITMLWTLDTKGFRQKSERFKSMEEVHKTAVMAASAVEIIIEMAKVDPKERASAAQMLVKCFNGEGLSTPRNRILAITKVKAKALAPVPTLLSTRDPARSRIRKSRAPLRTQRGDSLTDKRPLQVNNLPTLTRPIPGSFPTNIE